MRIVGEWWEADDGVTRPTIRVRVRALDGRLLADRFLIDSGADRTVLRAGFLQALGLPADWPPAAAALMGVGGAATFVLVSAVTELVGDDGGPATIRGQFAAFTEPSTTDLSILGRDVLDNFDLILSRRRDEIMLLAPNHRYDVSRA